MKFVHTGEYTDKPVVGCWYQLPDQSVAQCLEVTDAGVDFGAAFIAAAEFEFIKIELVTRT